MSCPSSFLTSTCQMCELLPLWIICAVAVTVSPSFAGWMWLPCTFWPTQAKASGQIQYEPAPASQKVDGCDYRLSSWLHTNWDRESRPVLCRCGLQDYLFSQDYLLYDLYSLLIINYLFIFMPQRQFIFRKHRVKRKEKVHF